MKGRKTNAFTLTLALADLTVKIDDCLISDIGNGDKQAFRKLYESTYESVYGFVLSIVKNKYDAEDVLHETFLTVYQKAGGYKPMGKPMAWIFTITKNAAYDKLSERNKIRELDESRSADGLDFTEITDLEDKSVIEALFKVLNDEEKQLILIHAVGGLKFREASEALNLPLNTVLSKYHRAIKKMQAALKEENL